MNLIQIANINDVVTEIHQRNVLAGWWSDLAYEKKEASLKSQGFDEGTIRNVFHALNIKKEKDRNVGELLCLVHSEISEAMEGHRKNLMDDKLPHLKMFDVELADAVIRIFDIAGAHGIRLGDIMNEKIAFNAIRKDHKIESRLQENGKAY